MTCPMDNPGLAGCHCPIKIWTDKGNFIAHWHLFHIEQLASHIVCEERQNAVDLCHYWTDRREDMLKHLTSTHSEAVKAMKGHGCYEKDRAWLDQCSFWMMAGIDKRDKTPPEITAGKNITISAWVIMDSDAVDPRVKTNRFRIPTVNSSEWRTMNDLEFRL